MGGQFEMAERGQFSRYLHPGRYVGVDTATDDDFDYEERLNEIHIELGGLNEEAMALANSISENFKTIVI